MVQVSQVVRSTHILRLSLLATTGLDK